MANKKSFICFSVYQLQNTSSGAGQRYFSSYQLCWEASYLSVVGWERSPSTSTSSSLIITIIAIIIFSIFNSTKNKITIQHLLNVTCHSFCDLIEKNDYRIKLEFLATGAGEWGLCLGGSRRKANEGLLPEHKSDFWSKSPLKQILSRARAKPQRLPPHPQRLSMLFDVLLVCVAS